MLLQDIRISICFMTLYKFVKYGEDMEKILIELAKRFNKAVIQWGIGGSLSLKHYNLMDSGNDIDIIVSESSLNNARQVLEGFAFEKISIQKINYGNNEK